MGLTTPQSELLLIRGGRRRPLGSGGADCERFDADVVEVGGADPGQGQRHLQIARAGNAPVKSEPFPRRRLGQAHGQGLTAELARAAARLGVPTAALALGWVIDREGVTAAVVGAKRPAQLRQSAQADRLVGRPRVWSVVDRIASLHGGS